MSAGKVKEKLICLAWKSSKPNTRHSCCVRNVKEGNTGRIGSGRWFMGKVATKLGKSEFIQNFIQFTFKVYPSPRLEGAISHLRTALL